MRAVHSVGRVDANSGQEEGRSVALARLQQRTTPDAVADVLREAILDGTLVSGRQMRETGIAADLGISRAPLREALRRLEEEGLVVKIPFRGAFVAEVSRQSIDDIARLRSVLEPWAIEQGLTHLQTERLPEMRAIVNQLSVAARKGNVQDSISGHLAFHRTVYEAAGNEVLTNLWRGWENHLRLFLAADLRKADDPMAVHRDHAVVLTLIEDGDLRSLRRLLGSHIHGSSGGVGEESLTASGSEVATKRSSSQNGSHASATASRPRPARS